MAKKKKKPVVKKEPVKKDHLVMREKSPDAFARNIKAMQTLGWDKTGFLDKLKQAPEKPVAVDTKIAFSNIKNPLVAVFIGFSTRRLLEALRLQKKVIRYVCIIEPDISVFKHLIISEDISDLLLDPSVDFVVGTKDETIIPLLFRRFTHPINKSGISRTTLIQSIEMILDPFTHTDEKQKRFGMQMIEFVKSTVAQIRLSMGCPDDQFRRLEMMIENKDIMCNAWNVKGLYDKFKDVPAIILGGGPSLADFIEQYKASDKLKNGLIVAVDAVLPKLLDEGIKPHLVVRCERKLTNIFEGVEKEKTEGIYYCAYPWTPKEFFDLFNEHFYLFRQNGVCLFTKITHGFVDGGVSSGNAALELAVMLGCKDIVISGLDMCMVGGKTHVDGTQVEFNIERSKDKWTKTRTNSGKEATTIPVWERCRKEYFQAIQKHRDKGRDLNVINTSVDGAVIPLTSHKPMKDVLPMFEKEQDIKSIIEQNRAKISQEEVDRFEQIVKDSLEKCKKYLKNVEIAEGLMEDAKRTADREIDKLVNSCKTSARDPYELILLLRNQAPNLKKLWSNVTDAIDTNFKKKLYMEETFRTLVFDVLQLQLYHYENTTNSLVNVLENEDHRHYAYYTATKDFIQQVKYYLEKFVALLA